MAGACGGGGCEDGFGGWRGERAALAADVERVPRRDGARARALLCQLPEHGRAFPALDAIQLHGTPTQGLTARKMAKYCDVVEVAGAAAGGGRRQGCAQRRVWG